MKHAISELSASKSVYKLPFGQSVCTVCSLVPIHQTACKASPSVRLFVGHAYIKCALKLAPY